MLDHSALFSEETKLDSMGLARSSLRLPKRVREIRSARAYTAGEASFNTRQPLSISMYTHTHFSAWSKAPTNFTYTHIHI